LGCTPGVFKKSNIDPGIPKYYRPVTMSSRFSKLLEIYTLEEFGDHIFHDLQFSFIENRRTNMFYHWHMISLSTCEEGIIRVFMLVRCQRSVWLYSPLCIIPESTWHHSHTMLAYISVLVSWTYHTNKKGGQYSNGSIRFTKGTRQGGLSSLFLFNILYHDIIDVLSKIPQGISINWSTFVAFC